MTHAELAAMSWAFVAMTVQTVLRSLLLAAVCGVAVWLLRKRTAELRFALWRWTLIALLVLPVLIRVAPPVFKTSQAVSRVERVLLSPALTAPRKMEEGAPSHNLVRSRMETSSPPWILTMPTAYLLVALTLLARLGYNLTCLRRMARNSECIHDTEVREVAQEIWLKSGGIWKPRIAASDEISVPVTFDAGDVWILLPHSWRTWSEAKLRAVLTHEMAHVRRGDSGNLRLASFATCVFWFHPLSWFLRRRLAALAEEACDEVVVESGAAPEQYAKFLIEFASEVKQARGRLAAEAIGVVQTSSLQRRIERLFADRRRPWQGRRAAAALTLALFVPTVYLTAAARFGEPQQQSTEQGKELWPAYETLLSLSEADAAALEDSLKANPEDLASRMELLVYAGFNNPQEQRFTEQMLWFIRHHPDIRTLSMAQGIFHHAVLERESYKDQILAAWDTAMMERPESGVVRLNAANFVKQSDPERGLQLLREAKTLDTTLADECDRDIVGIYAAAQINALHPDASVNNVELSGEMGARLRAQLEGSNDAALLSETGRRLVMMNHWPEAGEEQHERGLELIREAMKLDPGNARWREDLRWAETEPQRRLAYQQMKNEPPQPGVIRIGSSIAEAALAAKVEPVYPPFAVTARIQGTVQFTVTVGADGKVEKLELVSGHPLLVKAAKAAVAKWVYHPATQDGKGVPFVTRVIVPFRLD